MTLHEIRMFMEECEIKNVKIPLMTIVCEDFYKEVPKEMHKLRPVEFNHSNSRVNIIPIHY